ncbi:MAG: hypothetical protein R2692_00405 [Microbacterium sp.]
MPVSAPVSDPHAHVAASGGTRRAPGDRAERDTDTDAIRQPHPDGHADADTYPDADTDAYPDAYRTTPPTPTPTPTPAPTPTPTSTPAPTPTETPAPSLPEGTPEIVSTTSAGEGFERTLTVVLSGQPGTDIALRIDGERRADATLAADRAMSMIPTEPCRALPRLAVRRLHRRRRDRAVAHRATAKRLPFLRPSRWPRAPARPRARPRAPARPAASRGHARA